MPQLRKYATRADQQAAYRSRRALSERALLATKGLPAPASDPDTAWQGALERDARPGASVTVRGIR